MVWSSESDNGGTMYGSAVSRDGFSCQGNSFYVEVEGYSHERKDSKELYDLLTYTPPPPLLTKAGKVAKRQPPPYKDQPAHFYCAQLLHYGLKSMKMRDPAKKRLLAAFGEKTTLEVPPKILGLEKALKKEYKEANELARKKYEEEEQRESAEREKRDKTAREDREAVVRAFLESDAPAVVGTGFAVELDQEEDGEIENVDERPLSKPMTKQQLRRAVAGMSAERLRKVVIKLIDDIPAVERALIQELSGAKKQKAQARMRKPKDCNPEFTGQFQVFAPSVTQQFQDIEESMSLRMSPSSTGSHIWGSFNLGIVKGIIRASMPIRRGGSLECTFTWRGRESTGESTFSESNTGTITFLGGGKIKATIETEFGAFDFAGRKVSGAGNQLEKSLNQWKEEFRGYTWAAHERERGERWGKWGGEADDGEKPAESDTTVAEDSGSSEGEEFQLELNEAQRSNYVLLM